MPLFDNQTNRLPADDLVLLERQPQGILHRVLALPRRQVQNLEVFARRRPRSVVAAQLVVRHAKIAGRKHVLAILVVFERPRLADQRIDHVAVIHRVLPAAEQPRHPLHQLTRVPNLDRIGVNHHVHLMTNQAAGNRVGIAFDLDGAAALNPDRVDVLAVIELAWRKFAQQQPFLGGLVAAPQIALLDHREQKVFVLLAAGEVPATPQQKRLINGRLEMTVRRFHVAVLVSLTDVDPLRPHPVVVHQLAVAALKFAVLRKVVDRRGQAVTAMPARYATQLPERRLQPLAESLERLRETDPDELPVGIREREMEEQVREWLASDRHPQ